MIKELISIIIGIIFVQLLWKSFSDTVIVSV